MFAIGQKHWGADPLHPVRLDETERSLPVQQDSPAEFAVIDAVMAQLSPPAAIRSRGRPKADRAAIARSLVGMQMLGIPTVGALIERLVSDADFRSKCGWQASSEVPTPATFSRARAELIEVLPEPIHRLLPCHGRQMFSMSDSDESPVPPSQQDADPLLSILHRHLLSMVGEEEPELTLPQLAIFLTCYVKESPQTVASLADELDLFPADVARALIILGRRGLVARKIDPRHRRRIVVLRTNAGKGFLSRLLPRAASDPVE